MRALSCLFPVWWNRELTCHEGLGWHTLPREIHAPISKVHLDQESVGFFRAQDVRELAYSLSNYAHFVLQEEGVPLNRIKSSWRPLPFFVLSALPTVLLRIKTKKGRPSLHAEREKSLLLVHRKRRRNLESHAETQWLCLWLSIVFLPWGGPHSRCAARNSAVVRPLRPSLARTERPCDARKRLSECWLSGS